MKWGAFLFGFFIVVVVVMLVIYFFIPLNMTEFDPINLSGNSNFSLSNLDYINMQFYENMRYQDKEISYHIYNECSLKKKNGMETAFDTISNLTVIEFYPVLYGEEISVRCSDDYVVEGNMFIGGEGGVTNVTIVDGFHVIFNGEILLIRDSECQTPNIAIHELLHSLGFNHSENSHNIMYETTSCKQIIGDEIPQFLNKIYSVPSEPDLIVDEASAVLRGRYLDTNISIRNNGFEDALASTLIISANGKKIKSIDIVPIEVGYGRKISLTNVWINQANVEEIEFYISSDYSEIDKNNNVYVLYVKK